MKNNDKKTNSISNLIKEWQESTKGLGNMLHSLYKQQEAFKKSLKPFYTAQEELQKIIIPMYTMQEDYKKLIDSCSSFRTDISGITSNFSKTVFNYKKSIDDFFTPLFKQAQIIFEKLPSKTQEAILLLAEEGWFFDLKMPIRGLFEITKALTEGNTQEVEKALINYFESKLDTIKSSIIESYPSRKHIIESAFNAHLRKEYDLSIPVLLAQIDGICYETINYYFFIKKKNKPQTAIYVESLAINEFKSVFLSPLTKTLPISESRNERKENFDNLNRHMVLHGESLDYGTQVNSLKAISLLNYIVNILKKDKS